MYTTRTRDRVGQAGGVVQLRITKWKMENESTEWGTVWPNIILRINQTKHSAT